VVADRAQAGVVEEAAEGPGVGEVRRSGLRGDGTGDDRVGSGAAGVGGVLAVAGELHLREPDAAEVGEQLLPAAG
jgi:hypothetical protein